MRHADKYVYVVVEHIFNCYLNRGCADIIKCPYKDNLEYLVRRRYGDQYRYDGRDINNVYLYHTMYKARKHARIIDRYYIAEKEARSKKTGNV